MFSVLNLSSPDYTACNFIKKWAPSRIFLKNLNLNAERYFSRTVFGSCFRIKAQSSRLTENFLVVAFKEKKYFAYYVNSFILCNSNVGTD